MQPDRTIADFSVARDDGREISLADRLGQVVLVVNTASRCGFTPQYAGLEALWRDYRERGFAVLAFPCNQFGAQEPGTARDIAEFCRTNFALSLPLMAKIAVNGPNAIPLFRWLKASKPGLLGTEAIKWNFTKFLVDRQGRVAGRYGPATKPEGLRRDIEALL